MCLSILKNKVRFNTYSNQYIINVFNLQAKCSIMDDYVSSHDSDIVKTFLKDLIGLDLPNNEIALSMLVNLHTHPNISKGKFERVIIVETSVIDTPSTLDLLQSEIEDEDDLKK